MRTTHKIATGVAIASLTLMGCGNSPDVETDSPSTSVSVEAPAPTDTEVPSASDPAATTDLPTADPTTDVPTDPTSSPVMTTDDDDDDDTPDDGPAQAGTLGAIYPDMKAAMDTAESLRMKGTVNSNGQEMEIDLSAFRSNRDLTMTIDSQELKGEVLSAGGTMYMKFDDSMLQKQFGERAKALSGKWIKVTPEMAKDFEEEFTLDSMLDEVFEDEEIADGDTPLTETDVNGVPAWLAEGDDDGEPVKVYIAREGDPYLLKIEKGGTDSGMLEFSDYNEVAPVTAPPASQVVDLAALGA